MPKTKKEKVCIIFILTVALCLRLISINQSFWLDEATSGLVARNLSFSEIISKFSVNDFHPPLYYLFLKLWSMIFGTSEVALRSLSIFFGLTSIYFTYLIGSVFGKKVGLLSAVFMAINGLHIYYSQEARMYIVSLFFVTLLIVLFLKIMTSTKKIYWYLFSFALVLNAFCDYIPNLIIPALWLYAVIRKMNKIWWKNFILTHIPLLVSILMWLPYLLNQLTLASSLRNQGSLWLGVLGGTNLKNVLLVPVKFAFGRISFDNKLFYFILCAFVLCVYTGIIFYNCKRLLKNKFFILFLLWLVLPFVISAIIGFKVSIFSYFRFIFILPAFLIILAESVVNLPKKWRTIFISFVVFVSSISSLYYLITPRFHRENWRDLVSYVQNELEGSGYGVVFASGKQTEGYEYYAGSKEKIINVNQINPDMKKLWYIRYVQDIFDPGDSVIKNIESLNYQKVATLNFNGIIVWKYENSN